MKNIVALLLVLSMAFAFASCSNNAGNASDNTSNTSASGEETVSSTSEASNESQGELSTSEPEGVNESEWNDAIQTQNFENVTFTYDATFISGYSDAGPHVGTLELTEDALRVDGQPASAEERVAAKTMFVDTTVAIVNNFGLFEYDEEADHYSSKENIVYHTTILEIEATITAENVLVVFDEDNRIAKICCKMTQELTDESGDSKTYVLDVEFTFTEYGTTTLE